MRRPAFDRGVEHFGTLAQTDGAEQHISNPRRVAKAAKELRRADRALRPDRVNRRANLTP